MNTIPLTVPAALAAAGVDRAAVTQEWAHPSSTRLLTHIVCWNQDRIVWSKRISNSGMPTPEREAMCTLSHLSLDDIDQPDESYL